MSALEGLTIIGWFTLLPPHYFLLFCLLLLDTCDNHTSHNLKNDKNTHSKLNFQPKVGAPITVNLSNSA